MDEDLTAELDRLRVAWAQPPDAPRAPDARTVHERAAAIEEQAAKLPPMARVQYRRQHASTLGAAEKLTREQHHAAASEARSAALTAVSDADRAVLTEYMRMPVGPLRAFYGKQHRHAIDRAQAALASAIATQTGAKK